MTGRVTYSMAFATPEAAAVTHRDPHFDNAECQCFCPLCSAVTHRDEISVLSDCICPDCPCNAVPKPKGGKK